MKYIYIFVLVANKDCHKINLTYMVCFQTFSIGVSSHFSPNVAVMKAEYTGICFHNEVIINL